MVNEFFDEKPCVSNTSGGTFENKIMSNQELTQ